MSTINREAAIDAVHERIRQIGCESNPLVLSIRQVIRDLPSAQPLIIRCKDCKWWDKKDESGTFGYCHAIKHSYYSRHWEISIYRTYEADFFCADAEPKEEEDDPDKD